MEIIRKTMDDLTPEEIDIFIKTYPYKKQSEVQQMTNMDNEEIEKLKQVIEEERGIVLTKNKNFVKEGENPTVPSEGISSLTIMLNAMSENERQEALELSRNLPNAAKLVDEFIPVQVQRVKMGIMAEVLAGRGNNMHTENAVGNYMQLLKTKHEIDNGTDIKVEHTFASAIQKAVEREKEKDIIVEAETKKTNELDNLKKIVEKNKEEIKDT